MTTTPTGGADTAPKPATAENQPATEKPDAAAQARTAALAYANGVLELCQIAGEPSKAKAFIEKETPLDEVRKSLADARATASAASGVAMPARCASISCRSRALAAASSPGSETKCGATMTAGDSSSQGLLKQVGTRYPDHGPDRASSRRMHIGPGDEIPGAKGSPARPS